MRLEYVDLYLLHWPSAHPLEETMRAFQALVAAGKTRFVGVSNFDADEMLKRSRIWQTFRWLAIRYSTTSTSVAPNIASFRWLERTR